MSKGQMEAGGFAVLAIAIIVAAVLYTQIDTIVGNSVTRVSAVNATYTSGNAANSSITINGRDGGALTKVYNASHADITSQFQLRNTVDSDGDLVITLKTLDAAVAAGNNNKAIKVTYAYNPDGYMSGGARTSFILVLILTAVGVAAIALRAIQTKF